MDTGTSLTGATLINILVVKPSGAQASWTATQIGSTQEITYTTTESDLDEVGTYYLRSYIEWNTSKHIGEVATIEVLDPSLARSGSEKLIRLFGIYYRFLIVQTQEESLEETNTDADILYDSFEVYKDLAQDELDNLLATRSIPVTSITENQYNALMCHLIADYFEQGNPDWNFRSQSQAPGVSFSRGQTTGPREAFNKLFESIATAVRMSSVSSGRGSSISFNRIKDAANYPKRWKRTVIPAYDQSENGFDSDEVDDSGYDDRYNTGNQWS